MFAQGDRVCRMVRVLVGKGQFLCRIGAVALTLTAITAIDLPRLPWVGVDLGAEPAFAKNDRSSERSQANRGRGNDRRSARSDAQGSDGDRRVWNRSRDQNNSDNGRHLGHQKSDGVAASSGRRNTASALAEPPLPPRRPLTDEAAFRNRGDRVSTFVALAKTLGLGASVGAMQANFGTPFENGFVATDPVTGEFLKDPETGEFLIDASDAEIAAAKPGNGPKTGWEIETRLDVNMDGIVDKTDLDLAVGVSPDSDGDGHTGEDDEHAAIMRVGRQDGLVAP